MKSLGPAGLDRRPVPCLPASGTGSLVFRPVLALQSSSANEY